MRKILLLAAVLIGGIVAKAQDQKINDVIKVNTERYNFGKIKQSVPVTMYFEVTNTSNKPIVIENVTAGCGCTTPEVPKEPIAPGATTKIKVGYNAAALNTFEKDVFIKIAGVNETKNVKIAGEVLEAAAYDAYAATNKKDTKEAEATKIKAKTPAAKTKVKTAKTK